MKVLVIQQKMIGDVLASTILFEAIKKEYPDSELHYLINSHTYPVVEHHPFVDAFVFLTPEIEKSKLKFFSFLKKIRQEKYDTVIDVYGKIGSGLMSLYSGANIRAAYHKTYNSLFYNHRIKRIASPQNKQSLAIENRLRLLAPLGIKFSNVTPKIHLTSSELKHARAFLSESGIDFNKPLFMISVLGSGKNKTYPAEYMAECLDCIANVIPDSQILFNYIPKQLDDAKEIFDLCSTSTQSKIKFEVYGRSLREFLAITSFCNAVIGNEGGAINMAKALDIRTFTIFSPYINKVNWFGELEEDLHVSVHIKEFMDYTAKDKSLAKKNPLDYYLKFKPSYFISKLKTFLKSISYDL